MVGFLGCTANLTVNIPPEQVMHYPFSMALEGKTLAIGSASLDKEYDFGRLVTVNTNTVKQVIDGKNKKDPIDWNKVITSNILIPPKISLISFVKGYISFASGYDSELLVLPIRNGAFTCADPSMNAASCPGAKTLTLPALDPYSITELAGGSSAEKMLLVSYLSSDRIDIVKLGAQSSLDDMTIKKSFFVKEDGLGHKLDVAVLKNQRIITRKVGISTKDDGAESKAYFLVEQHGTTVNVLTKAKAAYLIAIKVSDLLAPKISDSMIELWQLSDLFGISGVQDFFVDENQKVAYVLARIPETIYKIDLTQSSLLESKVACTGAAMMAANKDKGFIVVPCFLDNRVAAFSMASLELTAVSKVIPRGPAFALVDGENSLIYCSFSTGGFVGILDEKLNMLGHLFNKAPENRQGS